MCIHNPKKSEKNLFYPKHRSNNTIFHTHEWLIVVCVARCNKKLELFLNYGGLCVTN